MTPETQELNIASWFVDRPAAEHSDRIAIAGEPAQVSYCELSALMNRLGNGLRAMGCAPPDRVLIALPDSVEFIAAFFGVAKIGAIAVPVNPAAGTAEFAHYLADSGARIVIAHAEALPQVEPALQTTKCDLVIVGDSKVRGACHSWDALVGNSNPTLNPYPTTAQDPAFFLYTTGSTGLPKAAVHRHKSMLVTTRSFAQGVLEMTGADRTLSIPKLFFAYGLGNGMYFPLAVGASTILSPGPPILETVAKLIARYRPTILFAVPTFLRALFKEIDNGLQVDLSSVRLLVYGGEPAPSELFERYRKQLGLEMLQGLGSTEMLQTFISGRPGKTRPDTCGIEVPNYEAQLIGDDGRPVADGEIGTLWLRGESSFQEYWNKPELTADTKVGDWVVTGDKLFRDPGGHFHFVGRGDDLIKISGKWFSPQEVESALCLHPSVDQAVVIAVTDDQAGLRRLVAYVVSRNGTAASNGELRQFLRDRFPERLIPMAFVQVSDLPLTGTGKIDRMKLPSLGSTDRETVKPLTPTEEKLAEIWSTILNIKNIGTFDDFLDLGGTSMLAIQCVARIKKIFEVDITVDAFFEHATIRQLAQTISTMRGEVAPLSEIIGRTDIED